MEGASIYWKRQGKKEEVGSAWEAVWIFGCSISNVLRPSYHLLLFADQFLPYIFLPSPELRTPGFPAVPAEGRVPWLRSPWAPPGAAGDGSSQPPSRTSRPGPSADDFRLSNCFRFSNKWSKSHSGSPWLLERCPRWTTPRSSCMHASWLPKSC